jgi:hypothetical protein
MTSTNKTPYPEHEKMKEISDKSQVVGEFLAWANENGMWIARYQTRWVNASGESVDELVPVATPTVELLAQFFEIDLGKIESEKQAMLDEIRQMQRKD